METVLLKILYFRKDAKKGNQNIKWIFRIKVLNNIEIIGIYYTRTRETRRLRGDLIERHLRRYICHIFKIYLLNLHKKVVGWTAQNILSVTLEGLNKWNDVSEEVITSKILAVLKKKLTFVFAITGETYSFFLAYHPNHSFTFKFKIRTTRNREVSTR